MTNEQTAVIVNSYMGRIVDQITALMEDESRPATDSHVKFLISVVEDMEADKANLVSGMLYTTKFPWRKN